MPGTITCHCLTCPKCKARLREARRRRLLAYGTYDNGHVDPTEAIAHVNHLRGLGMGRMAIAEAAGVSGFTVDRLPRRKTIHRDTAAKLLAVTGPVGTGLVPSWRAARRLRALSALGWTNNQLADRIGCAQAELSALILEKRTWTVIARFNDVDRVFRDLQMTPGPSARARAAAQRHGWVTALAWDDIDNPDEKPVKPTVVGRRDLIAEWEHLRSNGLTEPEALASLDVRRETVLTAYRRAGLPPRWTFVASASPRPSADAA